MDRRAKAYKALFFIFSVLLIFSSLSVCFSFAEGPVVVDDKNGAAILIKGIPGTIEDGKELKDSGTLTSMTLENEFLIQAFSQNPLEKVRVRYKTGGGKQEESPADRISYICRREEDYTSLDIEVFNSKNEIVASYHVQLEFREAGFFKRLYWKIAGNETVREVLEVLKTQMPFAVWETFYVTILSSLISFLIGLPLGVMLVAGDKNGIHPLPKWLMAALNVLINLLRSIPFLILMILVIPVSRAIVGTSVGTVATIVPLVFAAFPFVARLVESSLREINPNVIEAAQSMGASPFQIIAKVMIPESVPSLISNMTIALTTILGYSAMSGAIGGGGLGQIAINYGYYRYMFPTMVVAVVLLVLLVQIFQSIGTRFAKKLDKRLK